MLYPLSYGGVAVRGARPGGREPYQPRGSRPGAAPSANAAATVPRACPVSAPRGNRPWSASSPSMTTRSSCGSCSSTSSSRGTRSSPLAMGDAGLAAIRARAAPGRPPRRDDAADLDGFQVCAAVRADDDPDVAATPIVILSAQGAGGRRRRWARGAERTRTSPSRSTRSSSSTWSMQPRRRGLTRSPRGAGGRPAWAVRSAVTPPATSTSPELPWPAPSSTIPSWPTSPPASAAALVAAGLPDTDPALERPKQADHGDWATTVALRLAKPAKRPPRDIAQARRRPPRAAGGGGRGGHRRSRLRQLPVRPPLPRGARAAASCARGWATRGPTCRPTSVRA